MPKKGSKAFDFMTQIEVRHYQDYMVRHRLGEAQDANTRAGNTAYARAMKKVREQGRRAQATYSVED